MQADRESQHGAVRRAPADGRLGVRLGTPAATMRGFDDDDFREVASIIVDSLHDEADIDALRGRAQSLCDKRPLYPGFRGYTTYVA